MTTATTTDLSRATRFAPGELQCPKCNHAPFANRKGLAMHNARVHDRSIRVPKERLKNNFKLTEFKCAKCERSFKNEHGLHVHEARAHNRRHAKTPNDMVDLVLKTFASNGNGHGGAPGSGQRLDCPNCHYELEALTFVRQPAVYCPGCGTPIQAMVDRLAALAKNRPHLAAKL